MKKIILILLLACHYIVIAQTPVIPIEGWDGTVVNGAYYKDTNNVLNAYEGTWLYTNGNTSLKIILKKKTMESINGIFYEDLIIGEYQYIENGVEKINRLNQMDANLIHIYNHSIDGNTILVSPYYLNCTDCLPGEKRIYVGLSDPVNHRWGSITMKKTTLNNQEAIKIYLEFRVKQARKEGDTPESPAFVPNGWYTLVKQ